MSTGPRRCPQGITPGQAHACLVVSAMGWALYPPLSKIALAGGLRPAQLMTLQLSVAAAALSITLWRRGIPHRPPWRAILVRALLEPTANVGCFLLGLAGIAAAHASLLLAAEAPLTAVLAAVVLRERLSRPVWCGLLVCVPGLWLLIEEPGQLHLSVASLLVIAGTACSASYAILTSRAMRTGLDAVTSTAAQLGIALALLIPITLVDGLRHSSDVMPTWQTWCAAGAGGLLLAGPTVLYSKALERAPVGEAALIFNTIPVLGAGIGMLTLGERLNTVQTIGGLVVLAEVALVTASGKPTGPPGQGSRVQAGLSSIDVPSNRPARLRRDSIALRRIRTQLKLGHLRRRR
ncbi:DMT family transporter [Nonomuraea sp. NPDC003707]